METQKELLAPCGLYCGVCAIRIAHRDDNRKFKERLAPVYGVRARSLPNAPDARSAPARRKKAATGATSPEFPCGHIERFPVPVGKKVILRSVPQRRSMGTEEWVYAEERRYRCPGCGTPIFRGAKRCNQCKQALDLDWSWKTQPRKNTKPALCGSAENIRSVDPRSLSEKSVRASCREPLLQNGEDPMLHEDIREFVGPFLRPVENGLLDEGIQRSLDRGRRAYAVGELEIL